MDKRIIIVTYYWPPSGGSGVQRWLKFVKYLVRLGWEPIVLTPQNPSFSLQDPSLLKEIPKDLEVLEFPIWEPHHIFKTINKWLGKKEVSQGDFVSKGKKSIWLKISAWIRGNFFVPDSRLFWVKPSVTFLQEFMQSKGITKIVTTGPPHSLHLIGLTLKKRLPHIQWLADFRDPWSEWDVLKALFVTGLVMKRHRSLERQVLQKANCVVTVGQYQAQRLQALGGRNVEVITNGYDEEDFPTVTNIAKNKRFTIRFIGVVEVRDPRPFMQAILLACKEEKDLGESLCIEFVGQVNQQFITEVEHNPLLNQLTSFTGQLPHGDVLALYPTTDLLLLLITYEGVKEADMPGKTFEYMATGKPILAIGPEGGDCGKLLKETRTGVMIDRENIGKISNQIIHYYRQWKSNQPHQSGDISAYSRAQLTNRLTELLERMH